MRVQELAQRAMGDLMFACDRATAAVVGADQVAAAVLMARLAVEADQARQRIEDLARTIEATQRERT